MQMESRYKWVFILVFITILLIVLSYLVSEKLIRHLDAKFEPAGVLIQNSSPDEMTSTIINFSI
ncbi:MAG: hypothetical protein ABJB16_12740 [Saprospiraceae bacterium]